MWKLFETTSNQHKPLFYVRLAFALPGISPIIQQNWQQHSMWTNPFPLDGLCYDEITFKHPYESAKRHVLKESFAMTVLHMISDRVPPPGSAYQSISPMLITLSWPWQVQAWNKANPHISGQL